MVHHLRMVIASHVASTSRKSILVLTILACGLTAAAAAVRPAIAVVDAWSRPAVDTAVVYATIRTRDGRGDRLIAATSPLAARVEMHESMETAMPADSMNGMAMPQHMVSMKPLAAIGVPARGARVLSPGGYHLMLVRLRRPLAAGDRVPLRLRFARAGWVAVEARVRAI
jgi:copper(I)-binding protein